MAENINPKSLLKNSVVTGHIPGPMEQAAVQVYFERGSKPVLEKNLWRWAAFGSTATALMLGASIIILLPLKSIETIQINKGVEGRLIADSSDAKKFSPDDDSKAAWLSDWVSDLTEINAPTWQRNVERALSKTTSTAIDQAKDYLNRDENQPARLLYDRPEFVREFKRESINTLQPNVLLIRYTLTSRPSPGAPKTLKTFAMTVTLNYVKPKTREEVVRNPSGLVVQTFNISEESIK